VWKYNLLFESQNESERSKEKLEVQYPNESKGDEVLVGLSKKE